MSKKASILIDGKGADRIINHLGFKMLDRAIEVDDNLIDSKSSPFIIAEGLAQTLIRILILQSS